MQDYKPNAYLVRAHFHKQGEPSLCMTMDTIGDKKTADVPSHQDSIRQAVESLGNQLLTAYGIQKVEGEVYFEILIGATANRLARQEELLNHARNLMIDIEPTTNKVLQARVAKMIDEIGDEAGI